MASTGEKFVGWTVVAAGAGAAIAMGGLAQNSLEVSDALQKRQRHVLYTNGGIPDNVFKTVGNVGRLVADVASDEWAAVRDVTSLGTLSEPEKEIAAVTERANHQVFFGLLSLTALVGSGLVIAGKNPAPLAKTIVNRTPFLRGRTA